MNESMTAKAYGERLTNAMAGTTTNTMRERVLEKLYSEANSLQKELTIVEKKKATIELKLNERIEKIENLDSYLKELNSKKKQIGKANAPKPSPNKAESVQEQQQQVG